MSTVKNIPPNFKKPLGFNHRLGWRFLFKMFHKKSVLVHHEFD
jgi:hypothetical protein